MRIDQVMNIDITDTIAISQHKRLIANIFLYALDACAGLRIQPRINECHFPWFRYIVVHRHAIALCKIEGDVRGVQIVVSKVFLDHIAFITKANDKFMKAVVGVDLHNMPEDRFPPDFNHRLWSGHRLFADSRAASTC